MFKQRLMGLAVCGLVLLYGVGCEKAPETSKTAATPGAAGTTLTPEVLAKLAVADAADGESDKVVTKCALCKLGMFGSSKHVSTLGDYSLRFCSEDCKKLFDKDPSKTLLALNAPAAGAAKKSE